MDIKKKDGFKNERLIILPIESFGDNMAHPLIRGCYATDMGFFPKAKYHFRERRDGAEEAIFIYCMDGRGVIELNNKKIMLERGMAFTIPQNTAHTYYADEKDPWSILWTHFKGEEIDRFLPHDLEVKPIVLISPEENESIQKYFIRLFEISQNGYTLGNMICLSQLLKTILSETYFFERESVLSKANRNLTKAVNYMYANLNKGLTLNEVEIYMGLSKSYLNLIFKQYTKKSPLEFYTHLKMQQACKYLKLTNMFIYEISENLGYEDQYYFSRIFKKEMGVSPREYRKGV